MKDSDYEELERLACALMDETLSREGRERLEEILRAGPDWRRRYAELMTLESALHWEFAEAIERHPAEPAKVVEFSSWLRPATALAACLVAAAASWWALRDVEPTGSGDELTEVSEEGGQGGKTASIGMKTWQTGSPQAIENEFAVVNFDRTESDLIHAVKGVDLEPREKEALLDASYGVEVLVSGQGFGEGGYLEVTDNVTAWRVEDALRTGAEFGVDPFGGMDMLKFSRMEVDVFSQSAETSELVRVLDVRELEKKNLSDSKTVVKSAVRFNQGVGLADAGTEFAISLHAIDRDGGVNLAVGREEKRVMSDGNPSTWEKVESEMELPEGTDFVVVALSARKEGSQALLPDLSGHYADDLKIAMAVDGRPVYGRM